MFTSRAEYRLSLREDNADIRMTGKGRELGLVDDHRWETFNRLLEDIGKEQDRLSSIWLTPGNPSGHSLAAMKNIQLNREVRALDLLKRPEVTYSDLVKLDGMGPGVADERVVEQVQVQVKYAGYLQRQSDEIERTVHNEKRQIPADLDYSEVRGLSSEAREKLQNVKPATIGQAARIQGITPAAVSLLLIHIKKRLKGLRVA